MITVDTIAFHPDIFRIDRLSLNMWRLPVEGFLIGTPPRIGFHTHDLVMNR
jgi:hypothetical protein